MLNAKVWEPRRGYVERLCKELILGDYEGRYLNAMEYIARSTHIVKTTADLQPLAVGAILLTLLVKFKSLPPLKDISDASRILLS